MTTTWRIIPVSKWLVTPIYKPFRPFGRETTLLRGLTNHGYEPLTKWDDPPSRVSLSDWKIPGGGLCLLFFKFLLSLVGHEKPGTPKEKDQHVAQKPTTKVRQTAVESDLLRRNGGFHLHHTHQNLHEEGFTVSWFDEDLGTPRVSNFSPEVCW